MAVSFKGAHFPKEVILMGVRWYVAYPLSTRHVEELTEERGVELDHATIHRWVVKYSPLLEAAFHVRKRPVWRGWRMDETYRYYLENIRLRGSRPQRKADSIAQVFQAPRQPVHQLMTPLLVNIVAPELLVGVHDARADGRH